MALINVHHQWQQAVIALSPAKLIGGFAHILANTVGSCDK